MGACTNNHIIAARFQQPFLGFVCVYVAVSKPLLNSPSLYSASGYTIIWNLLTPEQGLVYSLQVAEGN